jgi:hypothetical protein
LAGKTVFALSGVLRNTIFGAGKTLNNRRLLDAIARLLCKDSSKGYFDLARRNPTS